VLCKSLDKWKSFVRVVYFSARQKSKRDSSLRLPAAGRLGMTTTHTKQKREEKERRGTVCRALTKKRLMLRW
jgi:hypothetical protein